MSVSSLNQLLSASPFDLAPGDSASERFNQHLRGQRRAATPGAAASSSSSSSSSSPPLPLPLPPSTATNQMCDQCGGIGGHTAACTSGAVEFGDIPVVERWLGKPVSLPGDADYPNTSTTPTNSSRYYATDANTNTNTNTGTGIQAPHPVFDQCSCNQCRESRLRGSGSNNGGVGGGGGGSAVHGGGGGAGCTHTHARTAASLSASNMLLTDLPEPILVLILKDLGFQSLCRVSQVSRALYLAARDATLWRDLVLDPFIIPDEVLNDLCNRSAAINALSLVCQGANGVSDDGMAAVATQSSLTTLALQNCRGVSTSMMRSVLENNTRLKHLNIKNCKQTTDDVVQTIGTHCTRLVTLNLMGCRNITDDGLRELSTLKKIEDLNMWGGGKWTDAVLAGLMRGSFMKLKVLELRFCKQVTDTTITAIASNCDDIERLGLAYCTALTDRTLESLLENCPKLIWLNVRDCPQISTAARTRFMEKRPFCHLLFNKIV